MTIYIGKLPQGPLFRCVECDSDNIICIREYKKDNTATTWERCKNCGYEWVWKEGHERETKTSSATGAMWSLTS